jgi:hypothetical protein
MGLLKHLFRWFFFLRGIFAPEQQDQLSLRRTHLWRSDQEIRSTSIILHSFSARMTSKHLRNQIEIWLPPPHWVEEEKRAIMRKYKVPNVARSQSQEQRISAPSSGVQLFCVEYQLKLTPNNYIKCVDLRQSVPNIATAVMAGKRNHYVLEIKCLSNNPFELDRERAREITKSGTCSPFFGIHRICCCLCEFINR